MSFRKLSVSENVDIENRISMTVIFPDSSLPEPTNGGFDNQEEFRKFLSTNQDGRWSSEFHARPHSERLADYTDKTIVDAFPLLFPYGFSGLPEDPAVILLHNKNPTLRHRTRKDVIQKYLQHSKPAFHGPMFNLVVENILMKDIIFSKSRMYCTAKFSDYSTFGSKYGSITADELQRAIHDVRNKLSIQHSIAPEYQYLKSIRAACTALPHSNEASLEARKIYFAFLMMFGLPAIFLTVNPDDQRNFRIIVYACKPEKVKLGGNYSPDNFSDDDIVADFKMRQQARLDHPGICAEEYERIIHLVIKHLFNWDLDKKKSNGVGIFAEICAFCLATEEQGRKSLHGHFLLFVRNWKHVLDAIQRCSNELSQDKMTVKNASRQGKNLYMNACSACLFDDFAPNMPLSRVPVFHHKDCRGKRRGDQMRYTIVPVANQSIREMRHKQHCHRHEGRIASCAKCHKTFTANGIVSRAINTHLGNHNKIFSFPDGDIKHLDKVVYELQKDFTWMSKTDEEQSLRYFASNALVNVHLTTHASRCFKKGPECYANLPEQSSESIKIVYNDKCDMWSDWFGNKEARWMFRFEPRRAVQDAFMNTHNPSITSLLGCNSNVMVGMNGRLVLYVTGYNVKSQQKEERVAFEKVSDVLTKVFRAQVNKLEKM